MTTTYKDVFVKGTPENEDWLTLHIHHFDPCAGTGQMLSEMDEPSLDSTIGEELLLGVTAYS